MSDPGKKGPLDVYRDAANEYGPPNDGCAMLAAALLCLAAFAIAHFVFGVSL